MGTIVFLVLGVAFIGGCMIIGRVWSDAIQTNDLREELLMLANAARRSLGVIRPEGVISLYLYGQKLHTPVLIVQRGIPLHLVNAERLIAHFLASHRHWRHVKASPRFEVTIRQDPRSLVTITTYNRDSGRNNHVRLARTTFALISALISGERPAAGFPSRFYVILDNTDSVASINGNFFRINDDAESLFNAVSACVNRPTPPPPPDQPVTNDRPSQREFGNIGGFGNSGTGDIPGPLHGSVI